MIPRPRLSAVSRRDNDAPRRLLGQVRAGVPSGRQALFEEPALHHAEDAGAYYKADQVTEPFVREIVCAGKMKELPALIEFVETACADAGINPDLCFDLTLAVEEAASNVIEHGYKNRGGDLSVRMIVADGEVRFELRDHAKPFKPGKVGRPDEAVPLEDRPLGGLGLHLMHQLMDEVRYETLADGNLLTMIKRDAS